MKARLTDVFVNRITIDVEGDVPEWLRTADRGAPLRVEIKKWTERRSLDANAYAWVLIDKIAAALHDTKEAIYRQAVREIGGVSDIVCVINAAVERLRQSWSKNGMGWQSEVMPSRIPGCTNVVLYYGSSAYDTRQMSRLIDRLIDDAKLLGIETMTPAELEKIKGYEKEIDQC